MTDAVEDVALRCALVSLEHIRDTIPAPPHHRTLNHKEAAALLAELERLRIDLEQERFQRAEAERLLELRTREYTVLRDWYRVALDRLRELGIDTSGYGSMT